MAEEEKGTSSWFKVPTWTGNPTEWRSFKKEMSWWMASLDADSCKKYNVAARWALRQHGVVRARCEEFDPDELQGAPAEMGRDPDTGDDVVLVEADPFAGLKKLMKALEESVGKTELDRRGELRAQFYQELRRAPGERISAFCTRFRTLASELKREGIELPKGELGWFLKDRMGLDSIRRQLLETALAGREEYEMVETEALRLFRDLHSADPLRKTLGGGSPLLSRFLSSQGGSARTSTPSSGSSQASTFKSYRSGSSVGSFRSQPFRKPFQPQQHQPPRQAMVAEGNDEGGDEEELVPAEDDPGAQNGEAPSLEEVLQMEAECLASELQELEDEGVVEPALIEELESGVETAAESLVTMREARNRIAEVRKDRGFGKIGGGKGQKGKQPKVHGNQATALKSSTTCWDCGEKGHWAGDSQCTRPGAGLHKPKGKGGNNNGPKQVKITESLNTEHAVELVDQPGEADVVHEAMVCSTRDVTLQEALSLSSRPTTTVSPSLSADKRLVGALDSACNRTCTGEVWLKHYISSLEDAPAKIKDLIKAVPESETFRFGNGGCKTSSVRYRIPMMIGSSLLVVWVSVVDVPSLGLLLGRDFLDAIGAVLSFSRKMLRADLLDGSLVKLRQLTAGHFALRLAPPTWSLPGALRWRKVGQDGVVEIQVSSNEWLKRKLEAHCMTTKPEHEHLVTEQSLQAASLCLSGLDDVEKMISLAPRHSAHVAQAMPTTSKSSSISTTSSTRSSQLAGRALPDGQPGTSNIGFKMGKNVPSNAMASRVARPWHALMVAAAALSTLCAVPLSQCQHGAAVAFAKRSNGGVKGFAEEACQSCQEGRRVHYGKPGRAVLASEQVGTSIGLRGGSYGDWDDGRSSDERSSGIYEKSGDRGCQGGGKEVGTRRQNSRSHSVYGWSQRRVAYSEGRPPSTGRTSSRGGEREADGGPTSSKMQRRHQGHQAGPQEGEGWSKQQQFGFGAGISGKGSRRRDFGDDSSIHSREGWSYHGRLENLDGSTRSTLSRYAESGDGDRDGDATKEPGTSTVPIGPHQRCLDGSFGVHKSRSEGHDLSRIHSRGDRQDERRLLRGEAEREGLCRRPGLQSPARPREEEAPGGAVIGKNFEYKIYQELKPGQNQMIAQAWQKHEKDRQLISLGKKDVAEILQADWDEMMNQCMSETFISTIDLTTSTAKSESQPTMMQEIFTASQRVTKEAERRGHRVAPPLSLETGWDFRKALDRRAALKMVREQEPYFLIIAYPCGPWSPLMRLNPAGNLEEKQEEARQLIRFALQLARLQLRNGRHFALENPIGSSSWQLPEVMKFLEEEEARLARFDQCRFGLRSEQGLLHKKGTQIATSSKAMQENLQDVRCLRDHQHQPVTGGSKITSRAGHYPQQLARVLVDSMEEEFHNQFKKKDGFDVLAAEHEEGDGSDDESVHEIPGESSDEIAVDEGEETVKVSPATRQAIRRLHENTGHRSNKRLARALAIAGAPPEVIKAARTLKCSICDERRPPRARRPASLPTPKDVSDQVHVDMLELTDLNDQRYYVIHCIDHSSRFQLAEVLPNKSTEMVIQFFKARWFPIFGPPRVLVADQGREFVSWQFEEMCAQNSVLLWHCAVQAPWQNGVCERGGGVLKAIASAIIKSQSVIGMEDMQLAVQEATTAYNHDVNDAGLTGASGSGKATSTSR